MLLFPVSYAQNSTVCYQATTPKEPLSNVEKSHLIKMAEEEKLAGDVYEYLNNKWNLRIFVNISKSERQHEKVVLEMIKKYDIDFTPKTKIGKFNNSDYEELYNNLTAQGENSILDALKVGATIEDLDIYDLDIALSKDVDNQDVSIVFQNIRQGSYHHIKAFTNWLKNYNETYSPQYITQQELNNILN